MQSADSSDFELLAIRHLSGENTAGEDRRLITLLELKVWRDQFAIMQRLWAAAHAPRARGFDAAAAGKRLAAAIAAEKKQPEPNKKIAASMPRLRTRRLIRKKNLISAVAK